MDASFGPNQLGTGTNEALSTPTLLPPSQPTSSLSNPANATAITTATPTAIATAPATATEIANENANANGNGNGYANVYAKHDLVSSEYIKDSNERKVSECSIENSVTTQGKRKPASSVVGRAASPGRESAPPSTDPAVDTVNFGRTGNPSPNIPRSMNAHSVRSVSSPQLTIKPVTRSKVYRKASLKSMNLSNSISTSTVDQNVANHRKTNCSTSESSQARVIDISSCSIGCSESKKVAFSCASKAGEGEVEGLGKGLGENEEKSDATRGKWNAGEVHITCNPLSIPYPYSTPHRNTSSSSNNNTNNNTNNNPGSETVTEPIDDEPKSRSCGSFLPILSLIPQTVVSFQYLSPKMKFSWWRNKIS